MAYRENPDASEVSQKNFMEAMRVIKPSVDENVLNFLFSIISSPIQGLLVKSQFLHLSSLFLNSFSHFLSKWVGESEKAIREIFKKAKQVAPCIVFLDEIDSIAPRRGSLGDSGVTERMVNQLLTSLDGIETLQGVVVIGATNRPDIVDNALVRSGRFDKMIYIPPPDRESRLKIFEVHTKNMPLSRDVNLEELADKTDGYVGADLENLCREAGMMAYRENPDASEVSQKNFMEAMRVIKPSVDENVLKFYRTIAQEMGKTVQEKRRQVEELGLYQ